jgi:hypothetical protein
MARTRATATARTRTPIFDAMIEEARRSPKDSDVGHEELGHRLSFTEEERRAAESIVDRWLLEDTEGAAAAATTDGAPDRHS